MKLNMDSESFGEWYVRVANHMDVNGSPAPLPSGDIENAKPGSIEAMFNCNYDAHVAANELAKRNPPVLTLREAAELTVLLLKNMTSDQFSIGYDRPCRRALTSALLLDKPA